MRIEEKKLKHWIDNFYGYGSWEARTWFIDYEEGGGDSPGEVAEKLNYFFDRGGSSAGLCDIRDLYRHVSFRSDGPKGDMFSNLNEYRFGIDSKPHGVWKNLIAFVHANRSKKIPDVLDYQRTLFASQEARSEALIPLYPLPSPHNHAWYYSWLDMPGLSFLESRASYEDHMFAQRMNMIQANIEIYKPEVVLMYGMNNINRLKKTFAAQFKQVKANGKEAPQHHLADLGATRVIITTQVPALRHNRIGTGFDWAEFGRTVRK